MPTADIDPLVLERMRCEWDERARENARHYINYANAESTDEEFFESGRRNVENEILTDPGNVFQGRDPKQMIVLEIGRGAGRITRALAEVFGQVYAVDISGEMIAKAELALADVPNAHVFHNNGVDLQVLGEIQIDFAFSYIVFQHIPSRDVIYSYAREVFRLLRPGGLFKFQVQGETAATEHGPDTWLGVPFTDADAVEMAQACGFEPRYRRGADSQYFWLWFFKPQTFSNKPSLPEHRQESAGSAPPPHGS